MVRVGGRTFPLDRKCIACAWTLRDEAEKPASPDVASSLHLVPVSPIVFPDLAIIGVVISFSIN